MVAKTTYPKLAFKRGAPDEVRAVMNKLIRDPEDTNRVSKGDKRVNVSRDLFERISKTTGQDAIDAASVFQILPDVELANQILVGSIISPKDMSSVELDFTVAENQFESELARSLLGVIHRHFKVDYKIDDRLDGILEEILFTRGAHILAVIPENNLDYIVNNTRRLSMESFTQVINRIGGGLPMGFLGHPRESRLSMETFRDPTGKSYAVGGTVTQEYTVSMEDNTEVTKKFTLKADTIPGLTVTDNFEQLKIPGLRKRRNVSHINKLMGRHNVSIESATKGLSAEEIDKLYDKPRPPNEATQVIQSQAYIESKPVGHPLVLKLPIESVIPVYVPGEPSEHIGYFILIDQHGRPVMREEGKDYYGELRSNFKANTQDNSSEMVRQVKEAMGGSSVKQDLEYDQVHRAYTNIIENDLLNRLRNGIYSDDFALGGTDEIYRVMLYRALKAKQTQLLYVPAELVTYMAFDYNKNGVGQTLLTQSKILSSMRSVLLFAETMSGVRNAIGRKKASITIDPHDPDPQKSISDIQNLIMESSQRGFPLGSPDPAQTLDYLNRAGFDFNINMDSEDYPTTKVEFDDYNTTVNAGNPDLSDKLRRMHISGMGLSPDWVDPTQSPEFAVSVVNNNLVMTRRVIRYQKRYTWFLSKFVRTYTQHSSTLRKQLEAELEGKKDKLPAEMKGWETEQVIDEFINAIVATLPAPDTTKIDLQAVAFDQYTTLLEKALDAYITADLFPPDALKANADLLSMTIATIKAYYQRMWLERNNVMPELDQLSEMDGNKTAFNLLDTQTARFKGIGEAIHKYLLGSSKITEAWAKKYKEHMDGGGSFAGEQSTDDLGGGDLGGDLGSLDIPGDDLTDDTPPEDTPPGDDTPPASDDTPPSTAEEEGDLDLGGGDLGLNLDLDVDDDVPGADGKPKGKK